MTDANKLDRARAEQALKTLSNIGTGHSQSHRVIAEIAARLAREGWTPPDPLEGEVQKIVECRVVMLDGESVANALREVARAALERGIEIGRQP